jgi:4-amino-4-deoxy-L-arabinose transferase-like glycosyltransferase
MRLFGLILLIAAVLRFWGISTNPPSLTWDEAAWGYNAYSLGIDLKDEFGRLMPLDYLESFGDFKPPVYAYLDILPVKFFGLNEFSTRLPSAFFGLLTVLLTYFLVKRIFYNSKLNETYALVSALVLAVSHWHVMLSRAAFEANVATFFIVLGVYLFLLFVQKNKWYLVLSILSFAVSIYTFNTARIVSSLLLLVLLFQFREHLLRNINVAFVSFIAGFIFLIPTLGFLLSPQASLRFKEVNIFTNVGVVEAANQRIANDNNAWWSKAINNRRIAFGMEYLKHYFDNLSPSFLFIKGDGNPKFSTQDVGQLFLWDLPFFVIGLLYLFRRKEGHWWLVPLWMLLAIVPAGTARETPHALRIEASLPTFQILVAYGFVTFINFFKKYKSQIASFLLILLFLNVLYFLHGYWAHYQREFSGEWQYGYKESIAYVSSVEGEYDQINVTEELGRPYIYYLFYRKTDPREFRRSAQINREALGFVNVKGYGKYRFAKDLLGIESPKNSLFIDIPGKVPKNAEILKEFNLLNGNTALVAYKL